MYCDLVHQSALGTPENTTTRVNCTFGDPLQHHDSTTRNTHVKITICGRAPERNRKKRRSGARRRVQSADLHEGPRACCAATVFPPTSCGAVLLSSSHRKPHRVPYDEHQRRAFKCSCWAQDKRERKARSGLASRSKRHEQVRF